MVFAVFFVKSPIEGCVRDPCPDLQLLHKTKKIRTRSDGTQLESTLHTIKNGAWIKTFLKEATIN